MTLRIKNPEVEKLAVEVAAITGEDETEAVRRALAERKERISCARPAKRNSKRFVRFLEEEVWPRLAEEHRGKMPTREEENEILGYGPDGV